jgi:hypothetical protein
MLAGRRIGGIRHRRQDVVIDLGELGGVFRLRQTLGDDEQHGLADIAHPLAREPEMRAPEHRRAVRPLAVVGERHAHRAHPRGREIVAGVDRQDARCRERGGEVHLADRGMRMRRAQHIAMSLAGQVDVVLEAAIAAQEALVLEAPHRLPDSELAHRSLSP